MNSKLSPFVTLCVSALFSVAVTHPAYSSDLETLIGQVESFAGPNVTLIVDTSGSMASQVFIDSSDNPYDATVDYTGPFDIYESFGVPLRLLYTLTFSGSIDYPGEGDVNSAQWIQPRSFLCAAGQNALVTQGFYTDRFAQFRIDGDAGIWDFPTPAAADTSGGQDNITECQSDFGVHGDGVAPGTYPINIDLIEDPTSDPVPWSESATDPQIIDWNQTGGPFTFFTPNYLNWIFERNQSNDPVLVSRLDIVKGVAKDLVGSLRANSVDNNDGLRVGLMRFSSDGDGGMVIAPTTELVPGDDAIPSNIDINAEIDGLSASGVTPLAETLYEAYRYHAGQGPRFGNDSLPVPSVSESLNGNVYDSPIVAACQKSYIVLLTDGDPNDDNDADSNIESLTGECDGTSCLDDLSVYMSTSDVRTGSGFGGTQSVDTFIIGFFADSDLLEDATTGLIDTDDDGVGDTPGYFLASNPDQLRQAFDNIFGSVESDVATFTAPAVTVNSLNRLTNRDTLYFTLYEPSPSGEPHWDGNLKAYKIGRANPGEAVQILDANNQPAVDDATGLFEAGAVSLWGSEADGPEVSMGGVAARLSAQRNIYSDLTGNKDLTSDANRITRENAATIGAVPGMPGGDELLELIDFTSGLNAEGGARKILGDPLHSQPLVINFDGGPDDLLLIFGSNDGYLHAIDPVQENTTTNDMEHFAFIPKALLPKQVKLKANLPSIYPDQNKVYGMDGPITAWIQSDDDKDFIVESGETLWVYAGMRRGGRGYYAFDMTNRESPRLEFTIDNTTPGYSNLGQTWSSASYAKIKLNDDEKDVLIFGGGYDPSQDNANNPDAMGNSVYIADATDGSLIWSAGGPGSGADLELDAMTHSIPSDVRIIDTNGDGFIDRMYVGDMKAQVWRFDINLEPVTSNLAITGGRIADLGGEGTANARRFYSAPSVSRYVENGVGFLAIGIGSGYRASPLNTSVDDRFYVLRDNNVYTPAIDTSTNIPQYGDDDADLLTTEIEMQPLTLDGIESGTTTIETGEFNLGWFLSLEASAGEKSLTSPITAEGRIFFTTYSPDNPALSCDPVAATGLGRFYGIDILTGRPALFDDALNAPPIASTELGPTGIPPQPKLVFVEPECEGCSTDPADDGLLVVPNTADIITMVGTQTFDTGLASRPRRTYWIEF